MFLHSALKDGFTGTTLRSIHITYPHELRQKKTYYGPGDRGLPVWKWYWERTFS